MDYHTARYSESGAGTRRGPAHLGSTLFGDLQTDAGGVSGMSLFDAMCYAEGSLQPFCSLVDDDAALATEEVLAVEDDHHKQCIPSLSSELHSQCRILEDQLSPAFLLVQYAAIFKRRDASGVTLQGWRKPQTESMARKPARTPVLPPAFPEKPERGQYVLGRLHRRILTQHVYTPTLRSSGEIARVPDTGEKRHSERARRKRDNEKRIDEVWNIPREKASILSVPAPVYKRPISRVARALGSCETVGAVRTQERRGWASGRGFESGLQPTSSSLVLKKASTTTLSYCPSQRNWGMGRMAYFQSPRWREESLRTAIREGSVSAFTGDLDDSRHEKAARIINQAHQTLGTLKRYGSAKYKAALRFLYRNVRNSEFDRGTETVHLFLKEMGINIKSNFTYPNTHFILVSGTLGKTSVATKIAAGLAESGLTVGVFTGPHLACLRERISVNGSLISESEIVYWVHVIRQTIAKTGTIPSFWECITLMALGHFTWQKCDYVVWETQKFRLAFDLRKVTLWTMRCLAIPCLAPRFDECASSSLSSTRETVREFLQCCNVLPKTATYSVVCGSFATPLWSKLQKHSPFRNITNVMLLGHQYRETMNDENTRIAMAALSSLKFWGFQAKFIEATSLSSLPLRFQQLTFVERQRAARHIDYYLQVALLYTRLYHTQLAMKLFRHSAAPHICNANAYHYHNHFDGNSILKSPFQYVPSIQSCFGMSHSGFPLSILWRHHHRARQLHKPVVLGKDYKLLLPFDNLLNEYKRWSRQAVQYTLNRLTARQRENLIMVNQVQNGVDNINSTTSFHRFSAYNNEALYWNFHELVALRERDSYSIRRPDVGYDSAVFAQQTKSSKRRFKGSSQKLDRLLAQLNGADAPHNALFPALGSDALAVLKGLVRSQDFLRHRLHNMRYLRPVPRAVVGDLAQSAVSWQRCIKQVRECFPGCSIRMCIALEAGHPVHLLNPVLSLLNTTGKDPTFPPCSITGIHFVEPTHCKAQQLNKIYAEILDDSSIVPPLRRLLIDSALEQLQWHFSVCPPLPTLPVSLAQLWLWRNPKPSQEAVKVKRLIFQRCRGLHFLNMPHPRYRYPDLLHVMSWKRLQGFHRAFSCTRRPAVKPSILHLFSPRINGEQQDVHHTLLTTRCRKSYVTGTTMAQKDLYKKVRNGVDLWDPPVRQSGPIKLFRDVGPIRKRDVEYNARRSLEKRLLTSLLMPRYIKQNRNDCLKGSPTLCRALGVLANEASHKAPVTQCVSRRTKLGRTVTRGNEPPDSGASSFSHVLGQHIEIEPRQLLREQRNALIALFGTRSCFIKRMLMKTSSCHLFWRQAAQKLYVGCRRGCDRHWSIGSLCPSEATPAVTRVSYTRFVRAVTVGVWLLWFSQYRHPCHIKRRWRRMCQGSNAPTSTSGLKSPMCLEKLVYQCVRWIVLYGQKTLVFQGTWKDFHATVGAHLWALLLPYNGSTISSDCPGSRRPCRDKKHLPLTDSQRNVILRAQYVSLLRLCCGETNPMERFCAFRSRKYWRWLQAIIRGFASKEKPSPTTVRLPCSDSRETHALRKQKFQTLGDLVQAGDAQLHFSLLFQRAAAENSVLLILGSPIMGSELFSALGLFSENQKIDPLVISHSGVAPESNTGINGDGVNQRPITPVGKPSPYWVKRFILRGPVSVPREELLSNLVTVSPAALACEEANAYLPLAQSIRRCNAQTWEFELSHYVKENQFRV